MIPLETIQVFSERMNEPRVLRDKRLHAFSEFERLDLPTFTYGLGVGLAPELTAFLDIDPRELRSAMRTLQVPAGVTILPLTQFEQSSVATTVSSVFQSQLPVSDDALVALHAATWNDGLLVVVPPSHTSADPLVLDVPLGEESRIAHVLVLAESASSLELVLRLSGGAEQAHSVGLEIVAREDAHVSVSTATDLGSKTTLQLLQYGRAAHNAQIAFRTASFGGSFIRDITHVELHEAGAQGSVDAAFFGGEAMQLDLHSSVTHDAPHTTSLQTSKGLLQGRAHCVQHQTIGITQHGAGSDAREETRTLLLSDEAKMSPIPILEVEHDDVSASHAASTGRIDQEALFYAQSRGIGYEEAVREIAAGHLSPVIDAIPYDDVRNLMHDRLSQRLA